MLFRSASVIYSSGSNQFGDATNDTQTLIGTVIISGSLNMTGSLNAPTITGSLQGTSSWANNAVTASFITTAQTASYVAGANVAGNITGNAANITAYTINQNLSTTSQVTHAGVTASLFGTASWASNALTASYIATASRATSASYAPNIYNSDGVLTTARNIDAAGNNISFYDTNGTTTFSAEAGVNGGNASSLTLNNSSATLGVGTSGGGNSISLSVTNTNFNGWANFSSTKVQLSSPVEVVQNLTVTGSVGINTTPDATVKLKVSGSTIITGSSYFVTPSLTTGTGVPQFRFLDGVTTPTDTTTINSFYKEFKPTSTTGVVIGDGTLLYPAIAGATTADYYANANVVLYTGSLTNIGSSTDFISQAGIIQIQTNTGTTNAASKLISNFSTIRNTTAGGTVSSYFGFYANGLATDVTNNGTTTNLYSFYAPTQVGRTGAPASTNRWGVYIEDPGLNYFAGKVGIGKVTPTVALDISGSTLLTGSLFVSQSINIAVTPTLNNANTQFLSRNATTGDVEYSTAASTAFYPYGIGFAQAIGNFLT